MRSTLLRSLLFLPLLLVSILGFGQSRAGASLLRQAEELDRANKFEAATVAYEKAERAFTQAQDYTGRQKAQAALAALSERQANLLLTNVGGSELTTAPAALSAATEPAAAPVATAPAVEPTRLHSVPKK